MQLASHNSEREEETLPSVTFGICMKNVEKTIGRCVDTVIGQTYPQRLMNVIIVDGDSTDKTMSIVKGVLARTPILSRVYSDHGRGLGYARNLVLLHSKGEYVVFVDGDVELSQDFVQRQIEFMEGNPSVGISVGRYTCNKGNLISTLWGTCHEADFENFVGTDATIFRRRALEDAGGFDPNIMGASEDLDAFARIKSLGWRFAVNPNAVFFHKCKDSIRGLLIEEAWFGYGAHYFAHKHRSLHPLQGYISDTVGCVPHSLRLSSKVYRTKHWRSSFAIPLLIVLARLAWWRGYLRAHLENYGPDVAPSC